MIVSYNASSVKLYCATNCLVRFENKNYFYQFEENARPYYNTGVIVVNTTVVGLAPGTDVIIFKIFSPKISAKKWAFLT
jgi:hypothetical protein